MELSQNLWNRSKRSLKSKFDTLKIQQFCCCNIFQKLRVPSIRRQAADEWTVTNSDIALYPIKPRSFDRYGDEVYVPIPAWVKSTIEDRPQCDRSRNSGASKYADNWIKFDDSETDGNVFHGGFNNEVLAEVHFENKPINLVVNENFDNSNASIEKYVGDQVEYKDKREKEHVYQEGSNCESDDDWILLE